MELTCSYCGSEGLFERRLATMTSIQIDRYGNIPDDAEAVEVPGETYVTGVRCCACGRDL
jgi:hypothetical protein